MRVSLSLARLAAVSLTTLGLTTLGLAACNRETEKPAAAADAGPQPMAQTPAPAPVQPALPPTGFVGEWASEAKNCRDFAWTFQAARLDTPGEVFCTWSKVETTQTGWRLPGTCSAEGPVAPHTLVLTKGGTDAAPTLAVAGGPFTPITLVKCLATAVVDPATPLNQAAAVDARIGKNSGKGGSVRPYDFKHNLATMKAWRENDQVVKITEPAKDDAGRVAGETAYYFEPGVTEPFFVREPRASYAFDKGELKFWYDRSGRALTDTPAADRAERRDRLLTRARELRRAADG